MGGDGDGVMEWKVGARGAPLLEYFEQANRLPAERSCSTSGYLRLQNEKHER
jgi:hypothetical protein